MFDVSRDFLDINRSDAERLFAKLDDLYIRSPKKILEYARESWSRRSLAEMIAVGSIIRKRHRLTGKDRRRYILALLAEERFEDVIDLLDGLGALDGSEHAKLAHALVATGRFDQARSALETALLHGALADEPTEDLQFILDAQRDFAAGPCWRNGAVLVAKLLGLGGRLAAAAIIGQLSAHADSTPSGIEADMLYLARVGLTVLPAEEIGPLVRQIADVLPPSDSVTSLVLLLDLLEGRESEVRESMLANPGLGKAGRDLRLTAAAACAKNGDFQSAIGLLGAMSTERSKDLEVLAALSYCTGAHVLERTNIDFTTARPRKIFNLFPFNNEELMLKIRLSEMASWVDHFVLVEAGQTFTGMAKPLHYDEFKDGLGDLAAKIIHIKIETFPEFFSSPWARDCYQRDMAVSALGGLWAEHDLILLTDADEIVDRQGIEAFDGPYAVPRMRTHKFFLNYCAKEGTPNSSRRSGVLCKAGVLARYGSSYLRFGISTQKKKWNTLPSAGWHLTSVNDAIKIARKFRSYAHVESTKANYGCDWFIEDVLTRLQNGELEADWERREIDHTFPAYIRENQEELQDLIL